MLKTIKLFMVIFTFSFYSGIIFKMLIEIEKDLWFDDPDYEEDTCYDWGGYFMECYGIGHGALKDNAYDTTIIFLYFSFTSLTTVGFGDYHAKSNLERLVMAFFLLFGVAIFSYIMGIFLEILTQFKDLNADLNQGGELNKFFGVMLKFNKQTPFRLDMQRQIEHYFEYKWLKDKNMAYSLDVYEPISSLIPTFLVQRIFFDCLYKDFYEQFKSYFEFEKI